MNVGFVSLGCSKNLIDTEYILAMMVDNGHTIVNARSQADAIIINTCGFIDAAKKEAISTILEMSRQDDLGKKPLIIVTGCLAQRYPQQLFEEMPEIDALIAASQISRIPAVLNRCALGERLLVTGNWDQVYQGYHRRILTTPAGWSYLKIAEGCDNRCSYCSIPNIRGRFRSRHPLELVAEARTLVNDGVRELVLVAQDSTAYGRDLGSSLADLIHKLTDISGLEWIRVMYAYPTEIGEELIRVMSHPKVVPYLDIPIQHGSDRILRLMGRRYTRDDIFSIICRLRQALPDVALRTTLMSGFPRETDSDHQANISLLQEIMFDWAGVFAYSQEEGTPAGNLVDDIPPEIKKERQEELLLVQQNTCLRYNRQRMDRTYNVIVENMISPDNYQGRTYFQAPEVDGKVVFTSVKPLTQGDIVEVKITGVRRYDLLGEVKSGNS